MRGHGLPPGSDGIAHDTGHDGLRCIKAVVQAEEGLHIRIEPVGRDIHTIECIVIPALAVFSLVIDHTVFNLDLTGGEIPLEIQHIVLCVPEAEFHKACEDDILGLVCLVVQRNLMHFRIEPQRDKSELGGCQTILFAGDDGISHAVPAFIMIQFCLYGLPAGIPDRIAVLDIEVPASVIHGKVVVAVTRDPPEPGVTVKTVAAGSVADHSKEIFTAQIIDPRIRSPGCLNDIFPCRIVKVSEFHGKPPYMIYENNNVFCSDIRTILAGV